MTFRSIYLVCYFLGVVSVGLLFVANNESEIRDYSSSSLLLFVIGAFLNYVEYNSRNITEEERNDYVDKLDQNKKTLESIMENKQDQNSSLSSFRNQLDRFGEVIGFFFIAGIFIAGTIAVFIYVPFLYILLIIIIILLLFK